MKYNNFIAMLSKISKGLAKSVKSQVSATQTIDNVPLTFNISKSPYAQSEVLPIKTVVRTLP